MTAEPAKDGRIDGLAAARALIASAYDHVYAAAVDKTKVDQLFNTILMDGLQEVTLERHVRAVDADRVAPIDDAQADEVIDTYGNIDATAADGGPLFLGAAVLNRKDAVIEDYQQTCMDARECIETLAILAGVDGTKSITQLFFNIDHAAYEEPVRLLPFPLPEDEAFFHSRRPRKPNV